MTTRLYLDFETRSILDVTEVGGDLYSSHPSTEMLCASYAFDGGFVRTVKYGESFPAEVCDHIMRGGDVVAHNAAFDALIWNNVILRGVPDGMRLLQLQPEQLICTAAKCRSAGVPARLGDAAINLNLPFRKMTTGKLLVARLSHPKSVNPVVWDENESAMEQMEEYNRYDVETMRALDAALPDLTEKEREVWCLDWRINRRGIQVDDVLAQTGFKIVTEYKAELDKQVGPLTGGAVRSLTEVAKITKWAKAQGANLEKIGKNEISDALAGDLPESVRKVLELRRAFAKSSASKLKTLLTHLAPDSRVRDQFVYHGAGTGRWSGRGVQFQNLKRLPKNFPVVEVVNAIKGEDKEALKTLGYSPIEAVSSALRPLIVAGPGMTLFGADFSAIEARALAWLAGQEDVVAQFAAGEDIYCYVASRIFDRKVTKTDERERMIGKVAVLACGYQGGVKAFDKFAAAYGVDVEYPMRRSIVEGFRQANQKIVDYWAELEKAAFTALEFPGTGIFVGPKARQVMFRKVGPTLRLYLPSGRYLQYPNADVQVVAKFGRTGKQVCYKGQLAGKTGMFTIETYGGLWAENVTQAVCRDVMVEGAFRVEREGFAPIATIHDEVISEGSPFKSVDDYARLMTEPIEWARGLPLAVSAWQGGRYAK